MSEPADQPSGSSSSRTSSSESKSGRSASDADLFPLRPTTSPTPRRSRRDEQDELQRRAEYLLDEMTAGGADLSARDVSTDTSAGKTTGEPFSDIGLNQEIDDLLGPDTRDPSILPDERLPAIRSRRGRSAAIDSTSNSYPRPLLQPAARPVGGSLASPEPVQRRPTPESLRSVDAEIDELYKEVNRVLATRREVTGHALALLREAREIVTEEPGRLARAEYNLRRVRTILEKAQESRRQAGRYGLQVLIYLALWLSAIVVGALSFYQYEGSFVTAITNLLEGDPLSLDLIPPLLWALLGGGAGGVFGAVSSLLSLLGSGHELDRQLVVRYLLQPVLGVSLGLGVFALLVALFQLIEFDPGRFLYIDEVAAIFGFIVGYWQESVFGLLYRILGTLTWSRRRR